MKNQFLKLILQSLLLTFLIKNTAAQTDPHFTQYYLYPHFMNPGLTGVMDGDVRVSGIYRSQWGTISNPYATPGFTLDVTTDKNINIGASILSQGAGSAGFRYTAAHFSIAYTGLKFGAAQEQQLTVGLQAGLISRRFDPSKFQLDDQWIPGLGYNPGLPSSDVFPVTNSGVLDIGAGLFYHDAAQDKKVTLFGGAAVYHLNRPADPFVTSADLPYIPLRLSVHGGATVKLSDQLMMTPGFLWMQQGTAQQLMLGTHFRVTVNETTDFLAGTYYRVNDSFSPFAGITFNNLTIGASYDVTTSQLARLSRGTSAFELSLSYLLKKPGRNVNYFQCPRF